MRTRNPILATMAEGERDQVLAEFQVEIQGNYMYNFKFSVTLLLFMDFVPPQYSSFEGNFSVVEYNFHLFCALDLYVIL